MKKLSVITAGLICALALFSCSRKKPYYQINSQNSNANGPVKTAVKIKHLNAETKEYLLDKNIAVVIGYGYNDEATVTNLYQLLDLNYGVEKEDTPGLIKFMVFPDDFMVAGKVRVSSLYNQLEDKTLAGLLIVGAPEGLCNAVARLEDDSETGTLDYPVFSFFTQDDILGSESTSNFVLDYAQKTNNIDTEQTTYIPNFDATALILNSVQAMIDLRGPVPADKNLCAYIQKLVGKQKVVRPYFDSETGLQSLNHFIFE